MYSTSGAARVVWRERSMRFPLRERFEMALACGWPLLLLASGGAGWLMGWRTAAGVALAVAASVAGLYAAVPRLPLAGRRRWAVFGTHGVAGAAALGALVLVCPRDVLRMDGRQRKVVIARPDTCIRCAACIVQCPHDALRFRFEDDSVVEAPTIRRTRLNMLGRRSVEVPESRP